MMQNNENVVMFHSDGSMTFVLTVFMLSSAQIGERHNISDQAEAAHWKITQDLQVELKSEADILPEIQLFLDLKIKKVKGRRLM